MNPQCGLNSEYHSAKYTGAFKPHDWSLYSPNYGIGHPSVINSMLVDFLCLSFNRRGYNGIAWKMKDLLIYTWKTILCGSSTGLSAKLCVYIAFKGLDLSAPAVSLQTPTSLKPVRAGDFSGCVYRTPIQLVNSIHLMRKKKKVTSVRENSSSCFFGVV